MQLKDIFTLISTNQNDKCSSQLHHPASSNTTQLILPQEADGWIEAYLKAKAESDIAEGKKRLAENRLKEAMTAHKRAISGSGHQVIWKTIIANKVDTARLKKENPSLCEALTIATSRPHFVPTSKSGWKKASNHEWLEAFYVFNVIHASLRLDTF